MAASEYSRGRDEGYQAAVEVIAASQCTHCKLGVRVVKDEMGWSHPWTRSGVNLRCWARATRDAAAAAKHESAGNGAGATGGG